MILRKLSFWAALFAIALVHTSGCGGKDKYQENVTPAKNYTITMRVSRSNMASPATTVLPSAPAPQSFPPISEFNVEKNATYVNTPSVYLSNAPDFLTCAASYRFLEQTPKRPNKVWFHVAALHPTAVWGAVQLFNIRKGNAIYDFPVRYFSKQNNDGIVEEISVTIPTDIFIQLFAGSDLTFQVEQTAYVINGSHMQPLKELINSIPGA